MSGLTDDDFLQGLQDDIVKAVYVFGLHDGMHKAAVTANITGRPDGALTFNTVSASSMEAFLVILARVLDQTGGGSLSKVNSRKNIQKPADLKKDVAGLQTSDAAKKLKSWRNGILSHRDGSSTASAIAAGANLQIYNDYLVLLEAVFICIRDLCRENQMAFTGVPPEVRVTPQQLFEALMGQALQSGELLTRKLFDLKNA